MRMQFAIFAVVGLAAFGLTQIPVVAGQTADAGKTTWDKIYSPAQAAKGETVYNDKCGKCHGANGGGADAPALVGADFTSDWDGLSLYQLFDRTRSSMPQDDPGSMSREDTSAVVAYMLQKNGFPAGDAELASGADVLNAIKYVGTKK